MPKLTVNIGTMPRQLATGQMDIAYEPEQAIDPTSYIGDTVLLATNLGPNRPCRYFAVARLTHISPAEGRLWVGDIRLLPSDIEADGLLGTAVLTRIADEAFDAVAAHLARLPVELDEATSTFTPLDIYGAIGRQVRQRADNICGFSGELVAAGEGTATPIRPHDSGGELHVRNFLFLHDELARLYSRFAWTVGPDLEIVADSWAMGTDVLSTINGTGKLIIAEQSSGWPDERALAWHRQRFLDRLR